MDAPSTAPEFVSAAPTGALPPPWVDASPGALQTHHPSNSRGSDPGSPDIRSVSLILVLVLFFVICITLMIIAIRVLCRSRRQLLAQNARNQQHASLVVTMSATAAGKPSKGLSADAIKLLPTATLSQGQLGELRSRECAICLGCFEERDVVKILPPCGHLFHVECIRHWLLATSSCPLCRADLKPKPTAAAVEQSAEVNIADAGEALQGGAVGNDGREVAVAMPGVFSAVAMEEASSAGSLVGGNQDDGSHTIDVVVVGGAEGDVAADEDDVTVDVEPALTNDSSSAVQQGSSRRVQETAAAL